MTPGRVCAGLLIATLWLAGACGDDPAAVMQPIAAPGPSPTPGGPDATPSTAPSRPSATPAMPTAMPGPASPGAPASPTPPSTDIPADAAMAPGPAGPAPVAADAGMDGAPTPTPVLPPVDRVDADGPFETRQELSAGPDGSGGLFYPVDLGRDGLRHPIFVWGCGGGSRPASYATHLNRIASHGFVVIAAVSNIGDDANVLRAHMEWLLAENGRAGSAFEGKLDPDRIGAGGHSIGSVNTFLFGPDPRLRTTIHVAGGSLDDVNDPFAATSGRGGKGLVHPAAFICGETDTFNNVEKTEKDFAAAIAPVFFTVMTGSDHINAARDGLPVIVAWLRWQLGDEVDRRDMFLAPDGEFRTGRYVSQSKNW